MDCTWIVLLAVGLQLIVWLGSFQPPVVPCVQPEQVVCCYLQMVMAAGGNAGPAITSSLLELAPDGWLLAFIRMLPAKDRLSLFQVNRQLASRIAQCATSSKLIISDHGQLPREATAAEAKVRHCEVARMLLVRPHNFKCCVPQTQASFLGSLTSHITTLFVYSSEEAGHASACLDWHALCKLTALKYNSGQSCDLDMSMLCGALEAGQLQCLKSFSLDMWGDRPPDSTWERMARALGPQLKQLKTNIASLVTHLHYFAALQSIHLHHCGLTNLQAQCLCEHDLQILHLGDGVFMKGNHSQRSCGWGSLVVAGSDPWQLLAALPLAGLQRISITEVVGGFEAKDRHVMRRLLAQHGHIFEAHPGHVYSDRHDDLPMFSLVWSCEEMLPLVAQIRVACKLRLWREPLGPCVFNMVWRVLPACVQVVKLETVAQIDWVHLWQGLPEHVHTLELWDCDVPVSDLCMLVRTVPKHVSVLELRSSGRVQSAVWDETGVSECAPQHVTFRILQWQ